MYSHDFKTLLFFRVDHLELNFGFRYWCAIKKLLTHGSRCCWQPLRLKVDTQKYKEWWHCIPECINCTAEHCETAFFVRNGCAYLRDSSLCSCFAWLLYCNNACLSTLYSTTTHNFWQVVKEQVDLALLKLVVWAKDVGSGSQIECTVLAHEAWKPAYSSSLLTYPHMWQLWHFQPPKT